MWNTQHLVERMDVRHVSYKTKTYFPSCGGVSFAFKSQFTLHEMKESTKVEASIVIKGVLMVKDTN
jgi:hypothetical protein